VVFTCRAKEEERNRRGKEDGDDEEAAWLRHALLRRGSKTARG